MTILQSKGKDDDSGEIKTSLEILSHKFTNIVPHLVHECYEKHDGASKGHPRRNNLAVKCLIYCHIIAENKDTTTDFLEIFTSLVILTHNSTNIVPNVVHECYK